MIRMVPATHATTKNHGLAINRIKTVGPTNGIHIVLYRIEHVLSQSVYLATCCMIQSNSTVYTVFVGL
jgi:hypothetical protein